jgi:RND family efflux transporter MFP subunit
MSALRWLPSLLMLLAACGAKSAQGGKRTAEPKAVTLVDVTTVGLPRTIAVTGTLAAQEELVLGMQVGGRLLELNVDVGDRVEQGQVIARLDRRDFELENERAAAALAAAHARLGQFDAASDLGAVDIEALAPVREAEALLTEARLNRERMVTMVQEQLRASADLEAADASLAVANSRIQSARDQVRTWIADARQRRVELAQAQKRLADSQLVAPWPGRVSARHVTAGQVLSSGERIVTLLHTDPMRLRLPLPERLVADVKLGQLVNFTVDGGNEARRGRIVRLGAGLDRSNRTLLVEAEVENKDGVLLPGGFCRASIVVSEAQQVVVVPRTAVVSFAGIDRVFTVVEKAGGPAKANGLVIQVGRELGDQVAGDLVEVTSGLAAGVRIVAQATGLVHDAPVVVGK